MDGFDGMDLGGDLGPADMGGEWDSPDMGGGLDADLNGDWDAVAADDNKGVMDPVGPGSDAPSTPAFLESEITIDPMGPSNDFLSSVDPGLDGLLSPAVNTDLTTSDLDAALEQAFPIDAGDAPERPDLDGAPLAIADDGINAPDRGSWTAAQPIPLDGHLDAVPDWTDEPPPATEIWGVPDSMPTRDEILNPENGIPTIDQDPIPVEPTELPTTGVLTPSQDTLLSSEVDVTPTEEIPPSLDGEFVSPDEIPLSPDEITMPLGEIPLPTDGFEIRSDEDILPIDHVIIPTREIEIPDGEPAIPVEEIGVPTDTLEIHASEILPSDEAVVPEEIPASQDLVDATTASADTVPEVDDTSESADEGALASPIAEESGNMTAQLAAAEEPKDIPGQTAAEEVMDQVPAETDLDGTDSDSAATDSVDQVPVVDITLDPVDVEAGLGRSTLWGDDRYQRGRDFEELKDANIGGNFPVIDDFHDGIATSLKTIDLNAESYAEHGAQTYGLLKDYVNDLSAFDGATWHVDGKQITVDAEDIDLRVLDVGIPAGTATGAQLEALADAKAYAVDRGITLVIEEVP